MNLGRIGALPRVNGLRSIAARFRRDHKGAAAIEFALVAPLLVFSFLLMSDFATALTGQDATARKARRAVEGVLRFGDDIDKVKAFANADGTAAFSSSPQQTSTGPVLAIDKYYVCREGAFPVISLILTGTPCPHQETWYKITTSTSSVGLFGKNYNSNTKIDILVDKK